MSDNSAAVGRGVHSREQSLGEEIANAVSHGVGALAAIAAIPVLVVDAVLGARPVVEIFAMSVFGASMVTMYVISALYHALPAGPPVGPLDESGLQPRSSPHPRSPLERAPTGRALGGSGLQPRSSPHPRSPLERAPTGRGLGGSGLQPRSPSHPRSTSEEGSCKEESPRRRIKEIFRLFDHAAIYVLIAGTYTPFALGAFKEAWGWTMFTVVWGLAGAGVLLKCLGAGRHPVVSAGLYLGMGWLVLAAAQPLFDVLPFAGFLWLLAGGLAYSLGVVFFALDSRWRYAHFTWHLFVLAGTACHFVAVLLYA